MKRKPKRKRRKDLTLTPEKVEELLRVGMREWQECMKSLEGTDRIPASARNLVLRGALPCE